MFDSWGRREAHARIRDRVECAPGKQAKVVEMSVHEHVVDRIFRCWPDLVEMNQPAAEEIKKTHDDRLAFPSLDPIPFLEVRDERRI